MKYEIKCQWCEADIDNNFLSYNTPIMVIMSKVTMPYYFDKKECLRDWIKGITKSDEIK